MPYSFTKIEEEKTHTITFVFIFLVLLYFFAAWAIFGVIKFYALAEGSRYHYADWYQTNRFFVSPFETMVVFAAAFAVGVGHWFMATSNLVPRIAGSLQAQSLNPKDAYHQMLQNVIDEVSVATGGRKMEGAVIPTLAMNAFAIADFEGRAVIGVTEGLLARLSRAQIETVVGHEAAHILSGDCLATTVTSSLFKLYGTFLSGIGRIANTRGYRSRGGGGIIIIVYFLIWLVNAVSYLLNMFISRQKEFRADAVSVRLTRDPLSLAEALYKISGRWRGMGLPGHELEAIFIVNPQANSLDEASGFFSDLFSTHPPVKRRLNILLDMAHSDLSSLEKEMMQKSERPRQIIDAMAPADNGSPASPTEWIVHKEGQWLGPYALEQMIGLGWLKPDTWIKKLGGDHIELAYDDSEINKILQGAPTDKTTELLCPKCRIPLNEVAYEGVPVLRCVQCKGLLVNGDDDVVRVLVREDIGFSDRIKRMAEVVKKQQETWGIKTALNTAFLLACPRCQHLKAKMIRQFYTAAYHVEIDKCIFCGSLWFDCDELEILQCLIESAEDKEKDFNDRSVNIVSDFRGE